MNQHVIDYIDHLLDIWHAGLPLTSEELKQLEPFGLPSRD